MKVQFLKDLKADELLSFLQSPLYFKTQDHYACTQSYLAYNQKYFGSAYSDCSMIVTESNSPLICFYAFCKGEVLSLFDGPVRVFDLPSEKTAIAYQHLFAKIDAIFLNGINFIHNNYFTMAYFNRTVRSRINSSAFIDLSQTPEAIRMSFRNSYKPLINWGKKNITVEIFDSKNNDRDKFMQFKSFHIEVAGRQTRSDETWELQYDAISKGDAYLVLGYFQAKLVTAVYVIFGKAWAYYGVGVNDRELMAENLPIAHYSMMVAINKAKDMGLKFFDMGSISVVEGEEKLNAIAKFKKGFSNTCISEISYVANTKTEVL